MRNNRFYDRKRLPKKQTKGKSRKNGYLDSSQSYQRSYGLDDFLSDVGNQEVAKFFETFQTIQAKLNISQPGDIYEQEADRIAKEIVNSKNKKSSKKPKISKVKSKSNADNSVSGNEEAKIKGLKGKGSPLNKSLKEYYESRFDAALENVRVHTDSNANQLASYIQAKAFTHGNDIVFGKGQYQPETTGGKELIAHELVHTQQQGEGLFRKKGDKELTDTDKIQNKDLLKGQIGSTISEWKDLFETGINSFVADTLSKRIDKLEKGNPADMVINILGCIIDALSNFAPMGLNFILSISGNIISNLPEIVQMSQARGDNLLKLIRDAFLSYANHIETKLYFEAAKQADEILDKEPLEYFDNKAFKKIIESFFNTSIIDYNEYPPFKKDTISKIACQKATHIYEVYETILSVTNYYEQKLTYALPGVDKLTRSYEYDFVLLDYNNSQKVNNTLELLTRHYGARINYQLERPEMLKDWDDEIIHPSGSVVYFSIYGTPQLASTECYKDWFLYHVASLKSKYLKDKSNSALGSQINCIKESIRELIKSMDWVINKQVELRGRPNRSPDIIIFPPEDIAEYKTKSDIIHNKLLKQLNEITALINK